MWVWAVAAFWMLLMYLVVAGDLKDHRNKVRENAQYAFAMGSVITVFWYFAVARAMGL